MSKGLERLTEEREIIPATTLDGKETKVTYIHIENKTLAEKKLFELENIEQELGIDLVTLFKALNNGAWYKDTSGNICWCDMPKFSKGDIDFNGYHTTTRMYGVIWALTRKELEK